MAASAQLQVPTTGWTTASTSVKKRLVRLSRRMQPIPEEIWREILRLRLLAMRLDLIGRAASIDFRDPREVARVQAAWRGVGSPDLYASAIADLLERHAAWFLYYA